MERREKKLTIRASVCECEWVWEKECEKIVCVCVCVAKRYSDARENDWCREEEEGGIRDILTHSKAS